MNIFEKLFYYVYNILTLGAPYLLKVIIKKALLETNNK